MAEKLHPFDPRMLRKHFLETRRGRIAEILQRGPRTVEQLASTLKVTPNAVRAQLTVMERDGLIRRGGLRPGTTRPSAIFELTPALERLLSGAYIPLLVHLVRTVAAGLDRTRLRAVMRKTGKSLAAEVTGGARLAGELPARVQQASAFLNDELGAITHVVRSDGGFVIEGEGCPLAAITDKEPAVCVAIESLLHSLIDAPVRECCHRKGGPRCCFAIAR
jgi:predicted ArsR family transcriptional regulator